MRLEEENDNMSTANNDDDPKAPNIVKMIEADETPSAEEAGTNEETDTAEET